jgi:hypothetical protein
MALTSEIYSDVDILPVEDRRTEVFIEVSFSESVAIRERKQRTKHAGITPLCMSGLGQIDLGHGEKGSCTSVYFL